MPPKRDDKEESLCGKCSKIVREGIQCEICSTWWHPSCAGMSSDLCDSLGANQQLHWYCSKCNPGVGKLIQEVRKIQDRLDAIEDCLKKNHIDRSKEQSDSSLKLANIEGELLHLRQGISNHQEELEVMKVTLNEIQKRPTLEELKLDEDWPLLSGKKFSELAALEVEKKLDTVSKDLH